MAYRIIIELTPDYDLQHSSNIFNWIVALLAKRVGLVGTKNIELQEMESYKTLLEVKHGYYFEAGLKKYKEDRAAEAKEKADILSGILRSKTSEEDEDAIN